jgi:hypothetical protein
MGEKRRGCEEAKRRVVNGSKVIITFLVVGHGK